MKARCASCGSVGHVAVPGDVYCSKSFRAAQAVRELGLSMREAADLFGVSASSLVEWLRRDPEAHRIAMARAAAVRKERARSVAPLVELAARAVHEDGLLTRDAARSYGVPWWKVRAALRVLYPDVDHRRRRW